MADPLTLLRRNIAQLKPYSSARYEYSGSASVWLDANENPIGKNGLNRYPDPTQQLLRKRVVSLKGINEKNLFFGNGSDEAIDLLIRAFCEPYCDKILILTPTYGMYQVCAAINAVEVLSLPLNDQFQPDTAVLLKMLETDSSIKIVFICSPNNPTGNSIHSQAVDKILGTFKGIVVIDEAYIDFAERESYTKKIDQYPCLVVLQTASKAWGLAGIRLGMAMATEPVIAVLNRIKPPYNISALTQREALTAFADAEGMQAGVKAIVAERNRMSNILSQMNLFSRIYPSDANFIFVICPDSERLYAWLSERGIVIRNRGSDKAGALRITIGTTAENEQLITALNQFKP